MQNHDVWQLVGAANMIKKLEVLVEKLFDQANNGSQVVREPFIGKTVKPGAKDCHQQGKGIEQIALDHFEI
jgi:hypothetical protein